jgi:hypothetical protein
VCGAALVYGVAAAEVTCAFCGKIDRGHIHCPGGHYVCESCHNRDFFPLVERLLSTTRSRDPFEIAELAMTLPGLPMLGCQHAFIAGGALIAALGNAGAAGGGDPVAEVLLRTGRQAHGGYCGLTGVCGIAPAIGSVFSVLTDARCGTDEPQHVTMEAVIRVSRAIAALPGPSCCKAYVRAALEAGVDYLRERLGVDLPRGSWTACTLADRHPHGCPGERCPWSGAAT